jgi:class 3 adenylate cyclase
VEQLTKDLGVPLLVSEATRRHAHGPYAWRPMGAREVRGSERPIELFVPELKAAS